MLILQNTKSAPSGMLPTPHRLLTAALLIAIAAAFTTFIGCARATSGAAAPAPLQVQVTQVEQKDVPVYREWIGTLDGLVNADIKAEVSGYLTQQAYTEGTYVKQGQLLFQIDPRPFQASLDQAKGQLAQAEGQLEQARAQLLQAQAQVAVADALSAHTRVRESREQQEALEGTLVDRVRLAYLRYRGGVDTQLNALDADRDLFQAQLDLAQLRLQETLTVVQLYKALGGGWQ